MWRHLRWTRGLWRQNVKRYDAPISPSEVVAVLKDAKDNASGPDGITLAGARAIGCKTLAIFFNVWMALQFLPARFSTARTIFIAKVPGTTNPLEHRPITISSRLARLFHQCLARRLVRSCPFDNRQKGFMPVDGCGENVFLITNIIK